MPNENFKICIDCGWCGHISELVSLTADLDDRHFAYCPICYSHHLEEEEDDDQPE